MNMRQATSVAMSRGSARRIIWRRQGGHRRAAASCATRAMAIVGPIAIRLVGRYFQRAGRDAGLKRCAASTGWRRLRPLTPPSLPSFRPPAPCCNAGVCRQVSDIFTWAEIVTSLLGTTF